MAPRDGAFAATTMKTGLVELSRAKLPTRWGDFTIVAFADKSGARLDDIALVKGDVSVPGEVSVRVHSECLTGDALGSLRCDCGEQLHLAMERLQERDRGILLYMRQEGRGIGIAAKVQAYALQDDGLDTVQANLHLGYDDDLRNYDRAADMLRVLGAPRIVLHTNNPRKVEGLRHAGIEVVRRVPLQAVPHEGTRFYLETKRKRSGHLIDPLHPVIDDEDE